MIADVILLYMTTIYLEEKKGKCVPNKTVCLLQKKKGFIVRNDRILLSHKFIWKHKNSIKNPCMGANQALVALHASETVNR